VVAGVIAVVVIDKYKLIEVVVLIDVGISITDFAGRASYLTALF